MLFFGVGFNFLFFRITELNFEKNRIIQEKNVSREIKGDRKLRKIKK